MKKLILSLVLLAGMTFVACSKDDDGGNCVTCSETFEGETYKYKVCKNADGNATVEGEDTEMEFDEYVDTFCD